MTRKLVSLLLALILVIGCVPALAEDNTITIWTTVDGDLSLFGYSSYADAPGFQDWLEKTGINVEITEVADDSALLLLLASGDMPDIIRASKTFYSKGISGMLDEGLAIPLDEYLPEYAPNYWNYLQSSENIYKSAAVDVDGELQIVSFAGNFYPETSPYRNYAGMIIRDDFREKLGMEPITTLDEFYTYLKRCKEELGVKTPFMSQASMNDYTWKYGSLTSPFGLPCAADYQVDGVYHFGAYEPEFKDYLAFMNKLYVEGLLDPNFATTDNATAMAAMSSGESCAVMAMVSRFQVIKNACPDPELKLAGLPSLTAAKGEKAMMSYASQLSSTSFWCYVTDACEDIETALRFLDYPYTERGMDLANYGVEGTTFNYDEAGVPKLTEFVTANPDGFAIDPILRAYGLVNWSVIHRQTFSENRFPLEWQREGCAAWADSDYMKYMISFSSVPMELQSEFARLKTDIDTYMKESIANFIAGVEPIENFDNYIETLKSLGMDRYIEIQQIAIDPYYAK